MATTAKATSATAAATTGGTVVYPVILAVSFCHLLNDMMQSLFAALYPILQSRYHLDFAQIGLLTLAFQATASVLQPLIGLSTDRRPLPYSTAVGMGFTLVGLVLLSVAGQYGLLLVAAALVGLGSAVFHPESSRVARLASGGRYGLSQSLFQVGGNVGSAVGPLLAAFIVVPRGQSSVAWFSIAALLGMTVLYRVGNWQRGATMNAANRPAPAGAPTATPAVRAALEPLPPRKTVLALGVLALLVLTKYSYTASLTSYYTFYLIEKFGVSVRDAQLLLFLFLGAMALGTVLGGSLGDRFGSKRVIWFSILGVLPFTLALPYAGLAGTAALTVAIGVIIASAFPAIVVLAQELVPSRVGMIAGLFFGFAFGMGGLSAAALGALADARGIGFVYSVCSFLPLLGLLTVFLPDVRDARPPRPERGSAPGRGTG